MLNIYVGNLPFSATESEIEALFGEFGQVERVNLISDRETGRPRGFGFVEMADEQAGRNAIEGVNGVELGGRTLTANEARAREPRGGGGGGGRYR